MGNMKSSFSSRLPKALALILKKGKKTDNNVPDSLFPPEIIIEILSWLPVEYQGRVMLVCKHWYALIRDRHFIEKHLSRASKSYKFFYIPKPNASTEPEIYKHVYACDGLYLQKNRNTNKYRVHNPTTKQVLELPDPRKGSHGIVFSYVPSTSDYKFISIYDDESNTECCEVLSVETDEFIWRLLKMPTRDCLTKNRKKVSVVSTGDAVHCVRVIASGAVMVEVVSLDLRTEQFTVTKFPGGEYKNWEKVWPLNLMGKLALVDRMEEDICVSVLEDYKKQKWGKRKPLISSASMKNLEDKHGIVFPYSFDRSEMLRFWVNDRMFISYNLKTGEEEETERIQKEGHKIVQVMFLHQHSLVHLKGMQPENTTT